MYMCVCFVCINNRKQKPEPPAIYPDYALMWRRGAGIMQTHTCPAPKHNKKNHILQFPVVYILLNVFSRCEIAMWMVVFFATIIQHVYPFNGLAIWTKRNVRHLTIKSTFAISITPRTLALTARGAYVVVGIPTCARIYGVCEHAMHCLFDRSLCFCDLTNIMVLSIAVYLISLFIYI